MPPPPPGIVLDTNVALDWLLFGDPAALALGAAIASGQLIWCASPAMRREFEQVLARPALVGWRPDAAFAAAHWDAHALVVDEEPSTGPLTCRDPDDQVFIDLALATRCRWLVSRDRALLTLARRARLWGVEIMTPTAWSNQNSMRVLTDI